MTPRVTRHSAASLSARNSSSSSSSTAAAAAATHRKRRDEDDEDMSSSSSNSEDDQSFEPSSVSEEDDDDAKDEDCPSRRRSSRHSAAASSSSAAAAASSSAPASASKRKSPASSSSASARPAKRSRNSLSGNSSRRRSREDENEDSSSSPSDEEEEDDDASVSGASSDEDEEQLQHSRRRGRGRGRSAAAAACESGSEDSDEDDKEMQRRKFESNEKGKGAPRRRRQHGDAQYVPDDEKVYGVQGGGELLRHWRQLRALYEPPTQQQMNEIFVREQQTLLDHAATATKQGDKAKGSKRKQGTEAAAAPASSPSATPAGHDSVLVDFTAHLPTSVSQYIFTFVNPVACARNERVNRRWRTIMTANGGAVYKSHFSHFFPFLSKVKVNELRQQESDVDPHLLKKDTSAFFQTSNESALTRWAAHRTDGRAVPVYNPHAHLPLGTVPPKEQSVEELLRPKEGTFGWKYSLFNRLQATCVECRALTLDVYKLTNTRVCIDCAMTHTRGIYDVVNSGCAKGRSLLSERELARLPSVIEYDPIDSHKTIFYSLAMVIGMRNLKYGSAEGFTAVWKERVTQAQQRLKARQAAGVTTKRLIPKNYREGVGSSAEKTKGFFLCGRHNLATLFERSAPQRLYPHASLE